MLDPESTVFFSWMTPEFDPYSANYGEPDPSAYTYDKQMKERGSY